MTFSMCSKLQKHIYERSTAVPNYTAVVVYIQLKVIVLAGAFKTSFWPDAAIVFATLSSISSLGRSQPQLYVLIPQKKKRYSAK